MPANEGTIYRLAWDAAHDRLAVGGGEGGIALWKLDSTKCERMLLYHSKWVRAMAWRDDGAVLLSGSADSNQNVRLWRLE